MLFLRNLGVLIKKFPVVTYIPAAVLSSFDTVVAMSLDELPKVAVDSMLVMLPVQLELPAPTAG